MNIITIDFETFYDRDFSLSKLTTEEYVRDSRFEAIGLAFKLNDGVTTWVSKPSVARWVASVDWSDKIVVCQNTAFDGAILAWHYGVKPLAWADTLSMSRALYPHDKSHSLKAQAERMGIGAKGDEVLDWREMHARYADCPMRLLEGSDHALSGFDQDLPHLTRFLSL